MIRVAFAAATFAAMFGLLIISTTVGAQRGAVQSPASLTLEREIKRVEAEIDRIFAETLAQLPSIPDGTAHRMKRVQAVTLFAVGVYSAKTLVGDWRKSGMQMVAIGLGAAALGFLIGRLFHTMGG